MAPATDDVYAVDLHTHVGFLHARPGRPTPFDPVGLRLLGATARYRGLDAVVVTNHDFYRRLADHVFGVRVLPGIEVSTTRGHLLVVGPDPPVRTDPGTLTPRDAVALAHERGNAAIIPHPFRNSSLRTVDAPFDAVELNGKHPGHRPEVEALARSRGIPVVGGSDAHLPFEAGHAYTLVDSDELTPSAVVGAIRDGRVEPVVREAWNARLFRGAYARIHRFRGHVDLPTDGER